MNTYVKGSAQTCSTNVPVSWIDPNAKVTLFGAASSREPDEIACQWEVKLEPESYYIRQK